jgi:tetratricopeptide (TPR) repeat protein
MTTGLLAAEPLKAEQLRAIQELYDDGLALQAYELGKKHAPLEMWLPAEGQVLAGRLAMQLGGPRLGTWLHRRAFRAAPGSAEACYYYGLAVAHRLGSFAAWRWMNRRLTLPGSPPPDIESAWYALIGNVASALRDFETANTWMAHAREAAPESAWVRVCEASLREMEDRYDDAVALAQEAMALKPWFRPAVQSAAHLMTLKGREEEALALLREANGRLQNGPMVAQQYALEMELRDYPAASKSLDRYEQLSPLVEKPGREWLAAQRADVAYYLGDIEAAIAHGRLSGQEYWKTIADRLENPAHAEGKKVLLPVGFVRQHHVTCVPATLTAISHFWSTPADHLQVAEEICYSGTSHYHERKWARDHGWTPREFSVTEQSARALIDRGIPFTFTTIDPSNAHLQAIIGYDERRGTLSVRDPYFRNSGEALAAKLLERYRAHGPRGMALLPTSEFKRLEGLELPDAGLWDKLHELDGALDNHRREIAGMIVQEMENEAPQHRLALEARRRLAIYDGNPADQLAVISELAAQFPKNQTLQHERLALMREQSHREERLAIYERLLTEKETHPIFWQQYAQELRPDARRHGDAIWRLKRAIRRWPGEAANYYILANIYWDHRRFEEALELYHFAACLGDKNEAFMESYFRAALWFKRTEQVLALLRDRVARFGKLSSRPVMSLASALVDLERTNEAFAALESGMATRPDDGDLQLYAADLLFNSSTEHLAKAKALLAKAKEKAPRAQWLRMAAKLQRVEGRMREALALWQEVLALQPLAIDAHRAVARLLAETEGPSEALKHLARAADQHPHLYPLHQMWAEWVRDEPAEAREDVLRRVAAAFPHDAWIHRELGFFLADRRRLQEAQQAAEAAERLEPVNQSMALLKVSILRHKNQLTEARHVLEETIKLAVDNDYVIRELMELCATLEERRAALALVKQELVRQVTFGDGLLSYRQQASGTLDPAELLALLQDALADRPDLWHAWSATIQQLLAMNRLDEAWSLVQQATEQFPLLPRLWLDRAAVARAQQCGEAELEALQAAYRINPRWNTAVQALAGYWQRKADYTAARELLERAVAREPLDGMLRGLWAEALWRDGQRDLALTQLQYLVQVDPGLERAWDLIAEWSAELGCPEKALESVRDLTQRRGGEPRSWLMLAKFLAKTEQYDERLAALDKAIELAPRLADAHDMRAHCLASARRWDKALVACEPAVFGNHPPPELRWRAAWIEVQREDVKAAVARLREVVSEEPRYYPGWSLLADCYAKLENNEAYLEAAEALVRLSPQYEVSYGYLGEALHRGGNVARAMEAYTRAFSINPQYEFAGNALFDLQVERGEMAAASETIARLRGHSESHYVLAREARLAALLDDAPRASALIIRLATEPTEGPQALRGAVHALVEAKHALDAERALETALKQPEANWEAAREWVRLRLERGDTVWGPRLQALLQENQQAGERATYAYVESLLKANQAAILRQFVSANERWLKSNDYTWGAVAYAVTGIRDFQLSARWTSDWRTRAGAQPWMLVNAAEGLRALGQIDEARAVSEAALAQAADNGTPLHQLWLASDAASAGDARAAAELMPKIDCGALDVDYQFVAMCVQSVIAMGTATLESADGVFVDVRRQMVTALSNYQHFSSEPARKLIYRRCVRQIGRLRGTWLARLSTIWQWLLSF